MIKQELPIQYGQGLHLIRFVITFADLQALAAGTSPTTITLADSNGNAYNVPQGSIIMGVRAKTDTVFSGGSTTALTFSLGNTNGGTTYFTATYNMFTAVADTNVQETSLFKAGQDSSFTLLLNVVGDGTHDLNAYTAGQVHYDILIMQVGPINSTTNPPSTIVP